MTVGVLALQGSVEEHFNMILRAGDSPVLVKDPEDFLNIEALIIPGGESTTLKKVLAIKDMDREIVSRAGRGLPIWGTCAGLILLSRSHMGLIDIDVLRNGYGTQHSSFDHVVKIGSQDAPVKFIRAPRIESVGQDVEVVSSIGSEAVACVQGNIMVTTFHPEITGDTRVYNYFKTRCTLPG